jgi:hypothetical protein
MKLSSHAVAFLGFPNPDGHGFSLEWRYFFRNPAAMVRSAGREVSAREVTMALELMPDLFVSSSPRLVPGSHQAGIELIGDGNSSPDGATKLRPARAVDAPIGEADRGCGLSAEDPKQHSQVTGSDAFQTAGGI